MTVLEEIVQRIDDDVNELDGHTRYGYDIAMSKVWDILQEYLDKEKQQIMDAYFTGVYDLKEYSHYSDGDVVKMSEAYYTNLKAK